jgi:hypothetical protein
MLKYARVVLALSATACGMDCTLIGCDSGLALRFPTPPTAPFHVEATSPDSGPRSYDCSNNTGCLFGTNIPDYLPETVTLVVTYQGRTSTTIVRPAYEVSRPNGKGCGPLCRQATITLPLP